MHVEELTPLTSATGVLLLRGREEGRKEVSSSLVAVVRLQCVVWSLIPLAAVLSVML